MRALELWGGQLRRQPMEGHYQACGERGSFGSCTRPTRLMQRQPLLLMGPRKDPYRALPRLSEIEVMRPSLGVHWAVQ